MDELISRQSVIDMLDETKRIARQNIDGAVLMTFERVLDSLVNITNALPTIQPEPHWIPVTERLPEEPFGCLVTVWDTNPVTMEEFENILPYFVGWDGEQWNDADGEQCPFEVIAWWGLPEPYKGVTE